MLCVILVGPNLDFKSVSLLSVCPICTDLLKFLTSSMSVPSGVGKESPPCLIVIESAPANNSLASISFILLTASSNCTAKRASSSAIRSRISLNVLREPITEATSLAFSSVTSVFFKNSTACSSSLSSSLVLLPSTACKRFFALLATLATSVLRAVKNSSSRVPSSL